MPERVIFRKLDGEVFAIFPDQDEGPHLFGCYSHVGQHGLCRRSVVDESTLATPEEYASLLAELRGIYGELNIRQRWNRRKS